MSKLGISSFFKKSKYLILIPVLIFFFIAILSFKNIINPSLPIKNNSNSSMIATLIYHGNTYIISGTTIDLQYGNKLIDKKLGVLKDNINEINFRSNESNLSSNIPGIAYSLKGYDKDFRIMVIYKYDKVEAEKSLIFENTNIKNIKKGKDLFGKLKIYNNIINTKNIYPLDEETIIGDVTDKNLINQFILDLYESKALYYKDVPEGILNSTNDANLRLIRIKLKDGCYVTLFLYLGGYVSYRSSDFIFHIDTPSFNKLWSMLN